MKPNILKVLSGSECVSLTEAALQVLAEFGISVQHEPTVDLLVDAGAKKGTAGRICLDPDWVRERLQNVPRQFQLYDRGGGALDIAPGHSWTFCGGTVSRVAEGPGGTLRDATRRDVADLARLCDALPEVSCLVPVVEAQDVERRQAEIITFAETLAHTTKFVFVCPVEYRAAQAFVEMGRIVTGSSDLAVEPKVGLLATVLPALKLDDDCAATTLLAAREGLPLVCMGGSIAGSSSPNTVAGCAALKMAAELFLAVLAQVVRPGTPVLVDVGTVVLDMQSGDIGEAGPEYILGVAAMSQVARELNLPTYSCALHCEAKTGDFQAGIEKMAGLMSAVLSGVNLITNMGMISRCSAASYEQMVLDNELCAFLQRFRQGVTVNADTLALDVFREVGPEGHFLLHEHTARHCRSGEIWYPRLLDRTSVGVNAPALYDRAQEQMQGILSDHEPDVDEGARKELERWIEGADRG